MYNTNLHVPLVMRFPGRKFAGTRVKTPVELIDLPATILAVTGHGSLGTPEDPDARLTSGRSLLPDCAGVAPPESELWTFSENNRYIEMQDATRKIIVNRLEDDLAPRVFDLRADPGEQNPLSDPALEAELRARLAAWDATMPSLASMQDFESDDALRVRLEQTGYAGPNGMIEERIQRAHAAAPHPPGGSGK
jgi:arylsulfatase A-like enzyme